MTAERFQYPPELFALLVDAIPALCKAKKDVVLFFRGAGVSGSFMTIIEERLSKIDRVSGSMRSPGPF